MKNIQLFLIAALFLLVSSCKKSEDQYPSTVMKASYPIITLRGGPIVILNVGDTYVDSGATYIDTFYHDSGNTTSTTEVNTSEEGIFVVNYSAENRYGFVGTATRVVAVTSDRKSVV